MKFLKRVAERNAPLARAMEVSILSSLISGALSLLEAIDAYFLKGSSIDYRLIISLFIASLISGITAGLTKRLRDKKIALETELEATKEETPIA